MSRIDRRLAQLHAKSKIKWVINVIKYNKIAVIINYIKLNMNNWRLHTNQLGFTAQYLNIVKNLLN